MNKILLFIRFSLLVFSCNRKKENTGTEGISSADIQATSDMNYEIKEMADAIDSMIQTPHTSLKHHWDSVYHHHDSLFWHHHGGYSHSNTHDDHTHTYTPPVHQPDYHQHHWYPNHPHDSMIVVHGTHHHDSTNYHHHSGHDYHHHSQLDSIHHLHNIHHP